MCDRAQRVIWGGGGGGVVSKGSGREVGFQDGGDFSRLLKRKEMDNHALPAIVNLTVNPTPNLTLTSNPNS